PGDARQSGVGRGREPDCRAYEDERRGLWGGEHVSGAAHRAITTAVCLLWEPALARTTVLLITCHGDTEKTEEDVLKFRVLRAVVRLEEVSSTLYRHRSVQATAPAA